jgi:hypothetical protein
MSLKLTECNERKFVGRINPEAYPKNIVEIFGMFTQGASIINPILAHKVINTLEIVKRTIVFIPDYFFYKRETLYD